MTASQPDPYAALFAEIVAEWEAAPTAEDELYRKYYPETPTSKETDR